MVAEATIKSSLVESVLKTSVDDLCFANSLKNGAGSALAGAVGEATM